MTQSAAMDGGWEALHADEEGAGPPVLLVHGQPGLGTDWERVAGDLVTDHRVISPDRPGYGRSGVAPASMRENAELLADLLAGRQASPAVVVGHSYGGGIAILMAAHRPEVVRGLVLLGSVGVGGSINGFDHVLAMPRIGEVLSGVGLLTFGRVLPHLRPLARRLPDPVADRLRVGLPDERYAASVTRLGLRMLRTFVAEQRSLIAELDDVEKVLGSLRVPTSVLTGSWDVVVPPSVSADIAAAVPGAELVTIAREGHFLARDVPHLVTEAVRNVERRAG